MYSDANEATSVSCGHKGGADSDRGMENVYPPHPWPASDPE